MSMFCLRFIFIVAVLSCNIRARAQLVFIPDVQLRAWFNSTVPGCVDVDGYLDTSLPALAGVDTVNLSVDWVPFDLTGIEYLIGLEVLHLHCYDHPGTINTWPPNLVYLDVDYYASTSLPPLPANLREADIRGIPLTELPELPATLEGLYLGSIDVASIGPFPVGLERLELTGIWPQLVEIVSFPDSLLRFVLIGFADSVSFNCLPQLPDGMEFLYYDLWIGQPVICIPNIPANPGFTSNWPPFPPCTDDCSITGLVHYERERLMIYPNPVEDALLMKWVGDDAIEYTILDATGRVLSRSGIYGVETRIPVEMLSPGHYVLSVFDQRMRYVAPFIKM